MTAAAANGSADYEPRLRRLEDAMSDHELRLAGSEKREEVLIDLRDVLTDVHKSLAGEVGRLSKQAAEDRRDRQMLKSQMEGLSSALAAMRDHVTRESSTRASEIEREKIARQSLAGTLQEASSSLEAATPAAHLRAMMLSVTLSVGVIAKSVAEELSRNRLAAWLVVGAVLVAGFVLTRKRKAVP